MRVLSGDFKRGCHCLRIAQSDCDTKIEEKLLVETADGEIRLNAHNLIIEIRIGSISGVFGRFGDNPSTILYRRILVKFDDIFTDFNIEGVDNFDTNRTIVLFVFGIEYLAGICLHAVGFGFHHTSGFTRLAGGTHEFFNRLVGETEDRATVTVTFNTGDIGAHAKFGIHNGTAILGRRIVRDGNNRSNGASVLVFTSSKIGFFLTIEFVSFDCELFKTVLRVRNTYEIILFAIDKVRVTAFGESIGLDTENVLDALVRTFNHDGGGHQTGRTVTGVVDKCTDRQTGILVENGIVGSVDTIESNTLD